MAVFKKYYGRASDLIRIHVLGVDWDVNLTTTQLNLVIGCRFVIAARSAFVINWHLISLD